MAGRLSRVASVKRHRRWRSRKLLATLIVVAVVGGLGGAADLAYISLKGQAAQLQTELTAYIQAGQFELEAGQASLKQANAQHDVKLVAEATAHFVAAKAKFVAAGQLADSSRLLQDLEKIPVVADLVRPRQAAVNGIAKMGAAISDAGQELAALDGQLLKPAATGEAGSTLLSVLSQAQTSLTKVRDDFARAQAAAASVDVQVLPAGQQATLLKARDTISSALAGLDEFDRLVPVLTEVLGGRGTRNYLVEQVNPTELRAGGGFIGSYSLLRVNHGTLTLVSSGDSYVLANPRPLPGQTGFIPLPDAYREVIPQVSWSFVDSNVYPDFPSNAKAAERFVQPRLHIKLDGVIAIDYYAVAKMLELTGPLAVPGYSLTVNSTTFVEFLVQHDFAQDAIHKAILSAIAGPLMKRISALPAERWPALIAALNDAATGRHLQSYFNNASVQAEMDRFGWSGIVNPTQLPNYMMEVESNYGGSKANYFVVRHYTVVLTRRGSLLHHQVTVDLVNNIPYRSNTIVHYKDYLRLYVGRIASSTSNNLRPPKFPEVGTPTSMRLTDGWLPDINCCGASGQAIFEYDTPWPSQGVERIYWQKQPGTVNDKVDVVWNNGNGHTYRVSGDLGQDRIITLTPTTVTLTAGQPAQATLPSLSLG